jgi:WhiB family redox-sensing transcriptional regulator
MSTRYSGNGGQQGGAYKGDGYAVTNTVLLGSWIFQGACRDDADLFFEDVGQSIDEGKAASVCARCPVFAQCRAYIDEYEADSGPTGWFGFWAGETKRQRLERRGRERRARMREGALR